MLRGRSFALMLACLGALVPISARPADPSEGTVSKTQGKVSWSGHFRAGVTLSSSADVCTDPASGKPNPPTASGPTACDVFTLTVRGGAANVVLAGFGNED